MVLVLAPGRPGLSDGEKMYLLLLLGSRFTVPAPSTIIGVSASMGRF